MEEENWNEKLREYCSIGDVESVRQLSNTGKVNVNSQNKVNGWTALHWASKRNHLSVIKYLIEKCDASPHIENFKGDKAIDLCVNEDVISYFTTIDKTLQNHRYNNNSESERSKSTFVPNYLSHPGFIYSQQKPSINDNQVSLDPNFKDYVEHSVCEEMVLKIRNGSSSELDFIEVEILKTDLTFDNLKKLCCDELNLDINEVLKIRKLPNTIIRKDKDVQRLKDFQEIEVILKDKVDPSSPYFGL